MSLVDYIRGTLHIDKTNEDGCASYTWFGLYLIKGKSDSIPKRFVIVDQLDNRSYLVKDTDVTKSLVIISYENDDYFFASAENQKMTKSAVEELRRCCSDVYACVCLLPSCHLLKI